VLSGENRIPVEKALLDLLREQGITVNDLLAAMREEGIDVYGELVKRLVYPARDTVAYIYGMPWKLAALTLFALQALYIVNPGGLYKGFLLDPPREIVVLGDKVKPQGVVLLSTRLKNLV